MQRSNQLSVEIRINENTIAKSWSMQTKIVTALHRIGERL